MAADQNIKTKEQQQQSEQNKDKLFYLLW